MVARLRFMVVLRRFTEGRLHSMAAVRRLFMASFMRRLRGSSLEEDQVSMAAVRQRFTVVELQRFTAAEHRHFMVVAVVLRLPILPPRQHLMAARQGAAVVAAAGITRSVAFASVDASPHTTVPASTRRWRGRIAVGSDEGAATADFLVGAV